MTTYSHTISVNDSEYIALTAALALMIDHCNEQLAAGAAAPFWAHRHNCEGILRKLRSASPVMTSTNTFGRPPEAE